MPSKRRDRRIRKWPTLAEDARIESLALFMRIDEEISLLYELYEQHADPRDIAKAMKRIRVKALEGIEVLREAKRSTSYNGNGYNGNGYNGNGYNGNGQRAEKKEDLVTR